MNRKRASTAAVLHPPPLTEKERSDALKGVGEIGMAANIYLSLIASERVFTERVGATQAQNVASIFQHKDRIPVIDPVVALQVLRLVGLGMRGDEPGLPKPTPFVAAFALVMLNKSCGVYSLSKPITRPKLADGSSTNVNPEEFVMAWGLSETNVNPEEFVMAWGLSEWLAQNPEIRIAKNELMGLFESERQRRKASRPRGARQPALWWRGLQCVLKEDPDITAAQLLDWLENEPRTYDDDDIELRLAGDKIVVEDLATGKTHTIRKDALRVYLQRARNS